MRHRVLRFVMGTCLCLVLAGVLAYLQSAFSGADRQAAIRLVHEARVEGKPLSWKIDGVLPAGRKDCAARSLRAFYGHMEVVCHDPSTADRELRWQVSLADGMVLPDNAAAQKLGRGERPW